LKERDKRLALIIIGLLLLIPVAWALLTMVLGFLVDLFI
jgi:hypothetical protein